MLDELLPLVDGGWARSQELVDLLQHRLPDPRHVQCQPALQGLSAHQFVLAAVEGTSEEGVLVAFDGMVVPHLTPRAGQVNEHLLWSSSDAAGTDLLLFVKTLLLLLEEYPLKCPVEVSVVHLQDPRDPTVVVEQHVALAPCKIDHRLLNMAAGHVHHE